MSFFSGIANAFRNTPPNQKVDRYEILSPLLATGEYVTATKNICSILQGSTHAEVVRGRIKPDSAFVEKSVQAYNDYVKHLPGHEQAMEKAKPFSSLIATLDVIEQNITSVEDNFQTLFGSITGDKPEQNIKSSSLVVVGYLEKADNFCTWLSSFVEHLTADAGDMIPPFRTRELLNKATAQSEFAQLTLNKYNTRRGGLLGEVKLMQSKGTDLPIQSESGDWIDQYAREGQYSADEKEMMSAGMRGTMLMFINWNHVRTQARIELLTARKEWLTAKIIQEQSKLRGVDENSPEYKKMKKATEKYASIISKYEQQIERMRG